MKQLLQICIFLCLGTVSLYADSLGVYTEEMRPYNFTDETTKKASGFSVEIVNGILNRTGIKKNDGVIYVYPWKRAYLILENEKNAMLFTMTRTAERETKFKWVGPLAPREIWFWKLKSRKDITAETFEDAKKYTVGGCLGFASSDYLKGHGFNVQYVVKPLQSYKQLVHNRIDLVTASSFTSAWYMKSVGKTFEDLEALVKLDDRYDYYIALNKETPDQIVNKLQNALDRMKMDGSYEAIRQKYLH